MSAYRPTVLDPLPPRRFPRLWQGARPRWVPLRWWEQAFEVGYNSAVEAIERGYVPMPTLRQQADEPCAFMGCAHPASAHAPTGCTVERLDYYERRFTAEGERIPPRMRPCGCLEWREKTVVHPRLPRDPPPRLVSGRRQESSGECIDRLY